MKKLFVLVSVVCIAAASLPEARAANEEAEIRKMLDSWNKAFQAKDVDKIMSFYVKGNDLIAYDVIPPLDVVGSDAYRKNYETFLAAYDGPITSEFRDLRIIASSRIAFVHSLERVSGTLKGGQKSELWVRATSGLRKINGKWLIVHDHISVPADFDTGKAVLDSKPGH
jgi:uncharacterized protein (TIGR02246 family)